VAGVLQTAHVPGPRPGCSRGLAGAAFASPAAPLGFAATLRSVVPTPRVSAPRRRLGPTCRFAWRSTASFLVAGRRFLGRVGGSPGRGSWALAPGVSRAVSQRRPRHGLGEQGRPAAPAGTALGFAVLFQVFGRRPLTAASGGRPPVGFSPAASRRLCCRFDRSRRGVGRSLRRCEGPTPSRSGSAFTAGTGVPV